MNLTTEQIKLLAQLERDMCNGKQPYVLNSNSKWAFSFETLQECGVDSGQEVSRELLIAITKQELTALKIRIQLEKLHEKAKENCSR